MQIVDKCSGKAMKVFSSVLTVVIQLLKQMFHLKKLRDPNYLS